MKDEHLPVRVSERIQEELSLSFDLDGHEAFTSASIGITLVNNAHQSAEDILRDAHTAMYRAKAAGCARHEMFEARMHPRAVKRFALETDLRRAIERREFSLYYQPIIRLEDNTLVGFEALIRWHHPVRGLVMPNEFIPVAEEIGLITPIDHWVLEEACHRLRRWRQQFTTDTPLAISVNLSGEQFKRGHLHEETCLILRKTGADASALKFEITERVLINNAEATVAEIARLKELNIQLYIDDFGTGYSSLSYLRKFNIDSLKIDRTFISRIGQSKKDTEIVRNIVRLAHGLDMDTIAEGVETAEHLENLKRMGCDFAQGFYFSKPLDIRATEALILEERTSGDWISKVTASAEIATPGKKTNYHAR